MSEPLHELARRVEAARDWRVAALAALQGCGCSPLCSACQQRLVSGNDELLAALGALDRALATRDCTVVPAAPLPLVVPAAPLPQQRTVEPEPT